MSVSDRRAAIVVLTLVVAGAGLRFAGGRRAAPGSVLYRWSAAARPDKDSLASRSRLLARPLADGERIDVDRASAEELTRLPRVGPALAIRIVNDREAHGPFGALDSLTRVSGVGRTTLEAIRRYVTFSGALSTPRASVRGDPWWRSGAAGQMGGTVPVPVNTASEAELVTLPGIGPAKARAIIEERQRHGPYRNVMDLTRVAGIGPATVKRLEKLVRVP